MSSPLEHLKSKVEPKRPEKGSTFSLTAAQPNKTGRRKCSIKAIVLIRHQNRTLRPLNSVVFSTLAKLARRLYLKGHRCPSRHARACEISGCDSQRSCCDLCRILARTKMNDLYQRILSLKWFRLVGHSNIIGITAYGKYDWTAGRVIVRTISKSSFLFQGPPKASNILPTRRLATSAYI
jgi:hypothetical protein